jgi:prolyl-tRNA synthetase
VRKKAALVYDKLTKAGVEVLWDDRDVSAGEKFADSDLLGIPERLVVSEKALTAGQFELKDRQSGEVSMITDYAGTIL